MSEAMPDERYLRGLAKATGGEAGRALRALLREIDRMRALTAPAPAAGRPELWPLGKCPGCEAGKPCEWQSPISCDDARAYHAAGHAAGAALLAKLERLVRGKWELNLNWWSHTSDFAVYEDQGGSELGAGPTLAAAIAAAPEPGSEGGDRG